MPVKLTAAQWSSLEARVVGALGDWYGARTQRLSPKGQKVAANAIGKGGLRGEVKVYDLFEPAVLLGPGESPDGLDELGKICQQVPFTGNYGLWEPIRSVFAMTMRQLTLASDGRSREYERRMSWVENGEQPGPIQMTPPNVNFVNGVGLDKMRSDFTQPLRRQEFSHSIERIERLYVMWALGGSKRWPRERIDAEITAAYILVGDYLKVAT